MENGHIPIIIQVCQESYDILIEALNYNEETGNYFVSEDAKMLREKIESNVKKELDDKGEVKCTLQFNNKEIGRFVNQLISVYVYVKYTKDMIEELKSNAKEIRVEKNKAFLEVFNKIGEDLLDK